MGHKNKIGLHQQAINELDGMFFPKTSKKEARKSGEAKDRIFSYSTLYTYRKQALKFITFAKEEAKKNNEKIRELSNCRKYVEKYLKHEIAREMSPWTVRLEASALAKLFHCSIEDFDVKLPRRERKNIKRSRGEAERDKHFSKENNDELIRFCKSCGLRKSELLRLRGTDLIEIDGEYYITTVGKGGRKREAPVVGDVDLVVKKMKEVGSEKVWPRVSSAADIHHYRQVYAMSVYDKNARCIKDIPPYERYWCRNEMAHICLDKRALKQVSEALGHSRLSICPGIYVRGCRE